LITISIREAGAVPLLLKMLAAAQPAQRPSSRHALFLLQAMSFSSAEVRHMLFQRGGVDTLAAVLVAQVGAASTGAYYRPSVAAAAAEMLHALASDGAEAQKAVAAAPGVIEALVFLAAGRQPQQQQGGGGVSAEGAGDGVEEHHDDDHGRAVLAGSVALLSLSAGSPSTEVGPIRSAADNAFSGG
jgi:hypothetical protein